MSDPTMANLFSDIDAFLGRARRVEAARGADDGRTFNVWGSETKLTRAEISTLAHLAQRPLCMEAIAGYLGRNGPETLGFVTRMITANLMTRSGDLYGVTRS